VLALESGKAGCLIQVVMLSLVTMKKNAEPGVLVIPGADLAATDLCRGRIENDARFDEARSVGGGLNAGRLGRLFYCDCRGEVVGVGVFGI
jgi:hypothetical protein